MYTLKEICDKTYQALLDCGLSEKTIYGSNWYIWNRLIRLYGEDSIFKEEMVYNYCNEYFKKDIFSCNISNLSKLEYTYRLAFTRLIKVNNEVKIQANLNIHYYRDAQLSDHSKNIYDEYIQYCINDGNSERTISNKKKSIKKFLLNVDFDNISIDKVNQYLKNEKAQCSLLEYTIRIRMIRRFLEFSYNKGYLTKEILLIWPSKINSVGDKHIPSVYSLEEIKQLLDFAKNGMVEDNHLRNYAILNLIVYSGIRAADVAKLKLNNIDWRSNIILIVQSKTKKEISIPLIPEIGNPIFQYITKERKGNSNNVFLKENGDTINSSLVTNIINNYFRSSSLDIKDRHYGAHALRHSLATNLINEAVDAFSVANVLGHSDIRSVKIYAKVDIDNLRKCVLEAPYEKASN